MEGGFQVRAVSMIDVRLVLRNLYDSKEGFWLYPAKTDVEKTKKQAHSTRQSWHPRIRSLKR